MKREPMLNDSRLQVRNPAGEACRIQPALLYLLAGLLLSLAAEGFANDYADRTPGSEHMSAAMDSYEAGQYASAMTKFTRAAHWADKLAQFNLGVMHLHGQATEADPARAWAWFELSAERDYPHMMAVADQVWDRLDESERERAMSIYQDELLERFGDAVAVPRTANHMRRLQRSSTGSRLGFRSGNMRVIEVDDARWNRGTAAGSTGIIVRGTVYGGDEYYDPAKYDFYEVVTAESMLFEAEQRGEVKLGAFELVDEEEPGNESEGQ